jgi:hypothetical protein
LQILDDKVVLENISWDGRDCSWNVVVLV